MLGNFFNQETKGFTLIELLVVIAIISAISVAVFVALNPAKRLADARDTHRRNDIEAISTAVHEYIVDNKGTLPTSMNGLTPLWDYQIGNATAGNCTPAITTGGCFTDASQACVNLSSDLGKYLKTMPVDPLNGANSQATTGYVLNVDSNNTVIVKACRTGAGTSEGTQNITIPPITNLVSDSSLESWPGPWHVSVTAPATVAPGYGQVCNSSLDGACSFNINVTGSSTSSWYVQLSQHGISLVSGRRYVLAFYAKADSAHTVVISLQQNSSPYTVYNQFTVNLTTSWQSYTYTFTSGVTDPDTLFDFNMALNTGNVWIDNISFPAQ